MGLFQKSSVKKQRIAGAVARDAVSRSVSGVAIIACATLLFTGENAEAQGKGYADKIDYTISLNDGWTTKPQSIKSSTVTCTAGIVTEAFVTAQGIRISSTGQPVAGSENEFRLHFDRTKNLVEFVLITPAFPDPTKPAIYDSASTVGYSGTQVTFSDVLTAAQTPNHPGGKYDGLVDIKCYQCSDAIDNDGDGITDKDDPGCWADPKNPATYDPARNNEGVATTQCQDTIDNDVDGVADKLDPGCWKDVSNPATYDKTLNNEKAATTQCQDGIDNDGDGIADAADPGCWTDKANPATYSKTLNNEKAGTTQCQDGIDNDGDGVADVVDPGCWKDKTNPASYDKTLNNEKAATTQCQDGVDNDGDGVIDAADPGCCTDAGYDRTRNNESSSTTQCQDGIDNDTDGVLDAADPGCWKDKANPATYDRTLNNEKAATTQCQDGIDNDADGVIDAADPGCWKDKANPATYNKTLNDEKVATTQCQDGADNDGDGLPDLKDPGCQGANGSYDKTRNSEIGQCQDGLDNDADKLVDVADPGCWKDRKDPGSYDKTLNNERVATTECQDGTDNDNDGLIDLKDPGCDSLLDNNEGDEAAKLQVSTECVQDNKDGTFAAYFNVDNLTGAELKVLNDGSGSSVNAFAPAAAGREPPTTFAVGKSRGKVVVTFDGKPLVWSVRASGGALSSTTVSSSSPPCKAIVPRAECFDGDAQGFKATMGYTNPDDFERKIPVGAINGMTPAPADRGQPTTFLAGNRVGAFTVRFKDPFAWTLTGNKAEITSAIPVCAGGCAEVGTAQIKSDIDATAVALSTVAKKAADFLAAQAKKKFSATKARKYAVDAQRAKAAADAYVAQVQALGLEYPAVAKICPNPLPFCQSVNRGVTIEALKGVYGKMLTLTKRTVSRGYFNQSGKTNRNDKLIKEAVTLHQSGLLQLTKLPVVITECK